jgi:uncharacterized protein (TIGR01777 family)
MKSKRILISGGTGLIGEALSHSLQSQGSTVIKLVRRPPHTGEQAVQWAPNQPQQPLPDAAALALIEGCDAAIHLAGANLSTHRWTPAYKETIRASRIDSSRALVEILSRLKTPPRVLACASATGIYGDRGDEVLTEASAPGEGFLPDVCRAWEASPDAAGGLGIRVCHLRFGVVLATGGGALQKLLPVFKAALGGRLGDGRQWMSWITLEDVVGALEFALENEQAAGAFNTVAPDPVTNLKFTHELAHAVHRPAPWIVPAFALRALFGQMAQDTLLASTRALPVRLESLGFAFRHPVLATALTSILSR